MNKIINNLLRTNEQLFKHKSLINMHLGTFLLVYQHNNAVE